MSFRSPLYFVPLLLAGPPADAHAQERPAKRYAVVVGINSYSNRTLNDLKFAERDALELAKELTRAKNDYDVRLLLGSNQGADQATRKNILQALDAVLAKVGGKSDLVLMAVAGHGLQVPIKDADGRQRETPFFCPFDARADATDPEGRRLDPATLVDLNEVIRRLNVNGGKHNLLLIDACRDNPNLPRGRGVDGSVVENLASGTAVLFSCSQGLRAFETEKAGGGHGIFFHLVIEGLRGKAADEKGVVSWGRLSDYVQGNVDDRVRDWVGADYSQGPHEVRNLVGRPPLLTGADSPPLLSTRFYGVTALTSQQAWAKHLGRSNFIETNALGMKLVLIPPGEFRMGGDESADDALRFSREAGGASKGGSGLFTQEHPPHPVRITKPFWLGRTEVTVGQFRRFIDSPGSRTGAEGDGEGGTGYDAKAKKFEFRPLPQFSWRNPGWEQSDDHPVVNVSWDDAAAFCKWLSRDEGVEYRLPTEAEWEYACRAGTTGRYFSGDSGDSLSGFANIRDQSAKAIPGAENWRVGPFDDGEKFTSAAAKYKPNAFGLHDMSGNAAEWCSDWHGAYEAGLKSDPPGPLNGSDRVIRGGAWYSHPALCRSAARSKLPPSSRRDYVGFRVACSFIKK